MNDLLLNPTQELAEAAQLLELWKEGEGHLSELISEGVTPDLVCATLRACACLHSRVVSHLLDAGPDVRATVRASTLELTPNANFRGILSDACDWPPAKGPLQISDGIQVAVLLGVPDETGQWLWQAMCDLFKDWDSHGFELLFDELDIRREGSLVTVGLRDLDEED